MIFSETSLPGAFLIELEQRRDDRGFFARAWCRDEFAAHGLATEFVQGNVSVNPWQGTLRGVHWQVPPHVEAKLVRVVRGAVFDVIVDLRPTSPTFRRWLGVELRDETFQMLYVPEGFGHGFQTLTDGTEVTYLVSRSYAPDAARGIRYDDPAIGIDWPLPVTRISEQDRSWPLLTEESGGIRSGAASAPAAVKSGHNAGAA